MNGRTNIAFVWAIVTIITVVTISLTIILETAKNPTPLLGVVASIVAPTVLALMNHIRVNQVAGSVDQITDKVDAIHEEISSLGEGADNAK
jgi:outer membrane murein-binding lipoprotein Lpp